MCPSAVAASPVPQDADVSAQQAQPSPTPRATSSYEAGSRHPAVEIAAAADPPPFDLVEEWGIESFPASDPPSNW